MNSRQPASRSTFWTITALGAVVALVALFLLASRRESSASRPHIILITADTLRKDRLGSYGAIRPRTPVLDRLARSSYNFPNFVSASNNTNVSFASMHTGTFLRTHKVQGLSFLGYTLDRGFETLSELLEDAGYLTIAAVSSLVIDGDQSGLRQGFDVYIDCGEEYEKQPAAVTNVRFLEALDQMLSEEASGDSRVFAWLHYMDPHWPYVPATPRDAMFLDSWNDFNDAAAPDAPPSTKKAVFDAQEREFFRRQYTGEVNYLDEYVGRVLDALDERGILENSVVIFTSDHGENLGEREYFANHQRLYGQVSEPPLLVRMPGQTEGRLVDVPVQTVDLLPTCLDLAGLASVPDRVEGVSLVPWLDGSGPEDRTVFSEGAYQKEKIVRRGRYKLAYRLQPQVTEDASFEFYDIESDPAETRDLREEEPEAFEELKAALREFMGRIPIRVSVRSIDGKPHRVKGVLRTLRCDVAEGMGLTLEESDGFERSDEIVTFDLTVGGEVDEDDESRNAEAGEDGGSQTALDRDELVVEADWTAAFGVSFEVDGLPVTLEELRFDGHDPARTIFRSILYLDPAATGGDAPSDSMVRIEAEDGTDGRTKLAIRVDVDGDVAAVARKRSVPVFEIRIFGETVESYRIEPAGAATVRESVERFQILGRAEQAEIELVIAAGASELLADFRIADEAAPPAEVGLGRGVRPFEGVRYAPNLYSPRFRLSRETTDADPSRAGSDDRSGDRDPALPSRAPRVVIEIAERAREGVLGGLDLSNLTPEQREKLEKLGYLDSSPNKAN